MTPTQIQADVDRLLEIELAVAALDSEAKSIRARLTEAALDGPHVPLEDPDLEGRQFLARGSSQIVPIRLESDLVAASFAPDSVMHYELLAAAGDKLTSFFKRVTTFTRVPKDGAEYRRLARELCPPDTAAAVIRAALQRDKAGIPKSRIVIATDRARPIQ